MLQTLLTQNLVNCNCTDGNISKVLQEVENNLMSLGDKIVLNRYYEVGEEVSKLDLFILKQQLDSITKVINKFCVTSVRDLHTEENYLEKDCH